MVRKATLGLVSTCIKDSDRSLIYIALMNRYFYWDHESELIMSKKQGTEKSNPLMVGFPN
jgi:hypothetical protein